MTANSRVSVGHPVDVSSGAVFTIMRDFDLPGVVDLTWRRFYSTDLTVDKWLGRGWIVPYFMELVRDGDQLVLTEEQGRALSFATVAGELVVRNGKALNCGAHVELRQVGADFIATHWHHGSDQLENYVFRMFDERRWLLASWENHCGQRISISYDAHARPRMLHQELEGRVVELAYNEHDLIVAASIRTSDGTRTAVRYEYDADRHLTAAIDAADGRTTYEYDSAHRMILERNCLGSEFRFTYDDSGRCIHTCGTGGYMERRLRFINNPRRTLSTDGAGHTTTFILNAAGQVIQEISPLGAVTTTTYDEYGRPTKITDPIGATVSYEYDDDGNTAAITHQDGGVSRFVHNHWHMLLEFTQPSGAQWRYTRDDAGNVVTFTDPLGSVWRFGRDVRGLIISSESPGGRIVTRRYGDALRRVEVSDQISLVVHVEYDAFGNQTAIHDAAGLVQRVTYDALNRPVALEDSVGRCYAFEWNPRGELIASGGPGVPWERRRYDKFGELVEHTNALGTLRAEYDLESRLVAITNRAGERLERGYDADGRVVRETLFDGRTERYEYNQRGDLIKLIKPDGAFIELRYDALGILLSRRYSDGTWEEFAYDQNGNVVIAKNQDVLVELARDPLGRVVKETQAGRSVEHRFDLDGHRVARSVSKTSEGTLLFERDVRGRLTTISDVLGVVQELDWDAVNRVVARRTFGRLHERFDYDPVGRLLSQSVAADTSAVLIQRTYTYDEDNNLRSRLDMTERPTEIFYDEIGRVTDVERQGLRPEHFRYDANGAILQTHLGARTVVPGGKTLDDGTRRLTYGDNGCVSRIDSDAGAIQLRYNAGEQLIEVRTRDEQVATYQYDALGRRVRKNVGGKVTDFIWDGCVLAAEARGDDVDSYFYFSMEPVLRWHRSERMAYTADQSGAVREVFDEAANKVWHVDLDTFGNVRAESGWAACPFRFRGQYFDVETGLHYNFHRYYDPCLGDYLSPDPIGIQGGCHLYAYPRNTFLWDDPFGLECKAHRAEKSMDGFYNAQGYKKIGAKGKDLNANGIDAVYKFDPAMAKQRNPNYKPPPPPPTYIIAEAKSGSARLGHSGPNGDIQQMSDNWINSAPGNSSTSRLDGAFPDGSSHAADIRAAPAGDVSKQVYHPDKTPKPLQSADYGGPSSQSKTF